MPPVFLTGCTISFHPALTGPADRQRHKIFAFVPAKAALAAGAPFRLRSAPFGKYEGILDLENFLWKSTPFRFNVHFYNYQGQFCEIAKKKTYFPKPAVLISRAIA